MLELRGKRMKRRVAGMSDLSRRQAGSERGAAARLRRLVSALLACLAGCLVLPWTTPTASAREPRAEIRFQIVETENLRLIYYSDEHAYIVPHLARCFENANRFHEDLFRYKLSERVTVQLQDFDDHGYAGATTIPHDFVTIGIEPFEYVYDTCPTNERMNWVMNHELVHVFACDQARGRDRFFRAIFFGKVAPTAEDPVSMFYSYLTNPRFYAPRWYQEGIAVFMETWMAGGIGRAQSGYDEMVFRTMVRDGSYFYDIVGLESEGTAADFQVGQNSYLYGTRFVSYLAYRYGPEKVLEWFRHCKGSKRYFSSQFRRVYGVALDDEWRNWIAWEHEWQRANLESIRKYPITPYRVLSSRALGSVSRAHYDPERRKLYTAVRYPGEFAHIAEIDIDTGRMRNVCDVSMPALYYVTSLARDPTDSRLFFTSNSSRRFRGLEAVNPQTGDSRSILKNNRTGDLVVHPKDRSIWGVQHHNGISRLIRISPSYDTWQQILILPYGKDLFDIDISPDGRYVSGSLIEISGRQYLVRMKIDELLSGDGSYETLWEFYDNAPANFVFSQDGRYLFGTSYYTGVSNVFRYDIEEQQIEAISNSETGFFRPLPVSEDSLIVFRYTGEGFVPVMIANQPIEDISPLRYLGTAIANEHPVVRDWILPSPMTVNIDSLTLASGNYSGLRHLGLASAYPIAEGYKHYAAFGMRFNLSDPAWLHSLDLAFSYSPETRLPKDERGHFRFNYRHFRWTINGAYNRADFYDFFGPTKTSRKGNSLGIHYNNYLRMDGPRTWRYALGAGRYWGLERLPDYQNVSTSFDEFVTGNAELSYSNFTSTIGAIEPEKGVAWKLAALGTYVRSEFYPRAYTSFDVGFLLPIDHSSIWMTTIFGYSPGAWEEPFANFYFGGFGNNWVDHGSVNRYRKYYSFPGMDLNAIAGTHFAKAKLEWTLPPLRFKRFGFPALYCNWARLSLFSMGIATNVNHDVYRREVVNGGAQLNLKLVIFSSLESTLSLGYAVAAEKGWAPEDEFMISLKILR
jgi:hypothetical protein